MDFENEFLDWIHQNHPTVDVRVEDMRLMYRSYRGITITPENGGAAPIFPIERYRAMYEKGMDFKQLFYQFSTDYFAASQNLKQRMPDIELDREKILCEVRLRLMDMKKNKAFLEWVPYIPWQDLAAVPVIEYEDFRITIINNHLTAFAITKEELFAAARANVTPTITPLWEAALNSAVDEFGKEDVSELSSFLKYVNVPLYVLRAGDEDGASAVLDEQFLQKTGEAIGEDFYLLPASVHEFIAAPASMDKKNLLETVAAVNKTLEPEDLLSNNIYHYDREKKLVTIVSAPEQNRGLYGR